MAKSPVLILTLGFLALLVGPFLLPPTAWLPVTACYWIYEFLVTLLVLVSTFYALRKEKSRRMFSSSDRGARPSASILIAAHN